jgi:hypothetical protein
MMGLALVLADVAKPEEVGIESDWVCGRVRGIHVYQLWRQ